MNAKTDDRGNTPAADAARLLGAAAIGGVRVLLRAVGFVVYSVLALLEPVILYVLTAVAVILCAVCAFYGLLSSIAHPTHFPFGFAIGLIALCGLAAVGYYALVYWLEPKG
jgi:hypothetical protein